MTRAPGQLVGSAYPGSIRPPGWRVAPASPARCGGQRAAPARRWGELPDRCGLGLRWRQNTGHSWTHKARRAARLGGAGAPQRLGFPTMPNTGTPDARVAGKNTERVEYGILTELPST